MRKNTRAASLKIRIAAVVAAAAAVTTALVHSAPSAEAAGPAPVAGVSIVMLTDSPEGNFPWG